MSVENEVLDDNFVDYFYRRNPEQKKNYRIKKIRYVLSRQQRIDLLKVANTINIKHALMLETQLSTGLRVGELVNMIVPWCQLTNLNESFISVEPNDGKQAYTLVWRAKTKYAYRKIPIPSKIARKLRDYINYNKLTAYIFPSLKGGGKKRLNSTSAIDIVNRYSQQTPSIGRNIGSHALRRTYASYLLKAGISITDISKLLGHKNIKSTVVYLFQIAEVDELSVKDAVSKMFMQPKSKKK